VKRHFAPSFLQAVPPDTLNAISQQFVPAEGLSATKVQSVSPAQIAALVVTTEGPLLLGLQTGADALIAGLDFKPPPHTVAAASSWAEFDQRLKKVAPRTSMVTGGITATDSASPSMPSMRVTRDPWVDVQAVRAGGRSPADLRQEAHVAGQATHHCRPEEPSVGRPSEPTDGSTVTVRAAARPRSR